MKKYLFISLIIPFIAVESFTTFILPHRTSSFLLKATADEGWARYAEKLRSVQGKNREKSFSKQDQDSPTNIPEAWTRFAEKLRRVQETQDEVSYSKNCSLPYLFITTTGTYIQPNLTHQTMFSFLQWLAMELAQDILRTAADVAHDKEILEREHLETTHESLKKILLEEDVLEMMERRIQMDEDDLLEEESYPGVSRGDDASTLWAMGCVENYLESRLHKAHETETKIRNEEEQVKNTLEDLEKWEGELESTLELLDELKREKRMKEWKQFSHDDTGGSVL